MRLLLARGDGSKYVYDTGSGKTSAYDGGGEFNSIAQAPAPLKSDGPLDKLWNVGVDFAQGVPDVVRAGAGLAGLIPGVNEVADPVAAGLKIMSEKLGTALHTDPWLRKEAEMQQATHDGFLPAAEFLLKNPSQLAGTIARSVPGMVAPVGLLSKAGLAPGLAAQAGEGLMAAGSAAADIGEGKDYGLNRLAAVPLGIADALIARGSGKLLPKAFDIAKAFDIDEAMAQLATGKGLTGAAKAAVAESGEAIGLGKALGIGALREGVLEELPQSMQEQVLTNLAMGKPWDEDLGGTAATGLLAGGVMGGGFNALASRDHNKALEALKADTAREREQQAIVEGRKSTGDLGAQAGLFDFAPQVETTEVPENAIDVALKEAADRSKLARRQGELDFSEPNPTLYGNEQGVMFDQMPVGGALPGAENRNSVDIALESLGLTPGAPNAANTLALSPEDMERIRQAKAAGKTEAQQLVDASSATPTMVEFVNTDPVDAVVSRLKQMGPGKLRNGVIAEITDPARRDAVDRQINPQNYRTSPPNDPTQEIQHGKQPQQVPVVPEAGRESPSQEVPVKQKGRKRGKKQDAAQVDGQNADEGLLNAVPKQTAGEVPVRQEARAGQGVRSQDAVDQKAAGQSQAESQPLAGPVATGPSINQARANAEHVPTISEARETAPSQLATLLGGLGEKDVTSQGRVHQRAEAPEKPKTKKQVDRAALAQEWNENYADRYQFADLTRVGQEEAIELLNAREMSIAKAEQIEAAEDEDKAATARNKENERAQTIKQAKANAEEDDFAVGEGERFSGKSEVNAPREDGLGATTVKQVVEPIIRSWRGAPKLRVVNSEAELTPQERRMLERQGARRANGWYQDGETVLLGHNIRSAEEAVATLFHESLGHHGLRGTFGAELTKLLQAIYDGNAAARKAADQMLADGRVDSVTQGVEEYLADNAQTKQVPATILDRVKALLTRFARRMGLTKSFSNAEVAQVLRQASDTVVKGTPGETSGEVAFKQDKPTRSADELKALEAERTRAETYKAGTISSTDNFGVTDLTASMSRYALPNGRMANILGPKLASALEKVKSNAKINVWYEAIKQFAPLAAQLEKTYYGRQLKALLNLESATVQYLRTEFSRGFDAKVLQVLSGKKELIKGFDTTASALGWSMRQRLNDGAYFEEVKKELGDSPALNALHQLMSTDPHRSLSDDSRLMHDVVQKLNSGEIDTLLRQIVERELGKQKDLRTKGQLTVDYMAESLERGETVDRNSHTYNVMGNLSPAQREQVLEAVKNAFVEQSKLAVLSAATQTYNARRSIDTRVLKLAVVPFGLNISTTQETLSDVLHDYQALLDDPNTRDEAGRFASAVMAYLNKGEYQYNEGDTPIAAFDAVKDQLKPIYDALLKKDKVAEFGQNMQTLFNTAKALATETPMISERLVSTVGGFYIPQQRQSPFRVGLKMYTKDKTGAEVPVSLRRDQYGAFLQSMGSEDEMDRFIKQFNAEKPETFQVLDAMGDVHDAYFKAEANTSIYDNLSDAPALFNARQFLHQLEVAGVNLSQKNTEKILRAMTKQHAKTLRAIQANSAYGADIDALKYIGQYMNNAAFRVADNMYGADVDGLLSNTFKWSLTNVQNELEQWKTYQNSLPKDATNRPLVAAQIAQLEDGVKLAEANPNWGRESRVLARDAVAAYRDENGRSPAMLDKIRKWGAVSMLGGNLASVVTNVLGGGPSAISALAYQTEGGFGGGYGAAPAVTTFMGALKDGLQVGTTLLTRDGVSKLERQVAAMPAGGEKAIWEQMVQEIKSGKLQVGQALSLAQLANEGFSSKNAKIDKFTELYMKPFTASETAIRVATFLSAARLELDQQLQGKELGSVSAGEREALLNSVWRKADAIVEAAQGNYETWAKGAALRGGLSGTFLMFMHYPMVQLQLLKNMDARGRAMYLGILFLMAGADGEPFADDLKNIYNQLAKAFPTQFAEHDARAWWLRFAHGIEEQTGVPSELIRKGALSAVTGYDFSSLGLGSILRGDRGITDKAGIVDTLGPGAAFLMGAGDAATELASAGSAALKGQGELANEHFFRAAKASPVKAFKAAADAYDIGTTGASHTRSGLKVAGDLDGVDALVRSIGFRGNTVSEQYEKADIIQSKKDMQTELQKYFNNLFVTAGIERDPKLRQEAMEKMRDMNDALKGSGIALKYDANVVLKGVKEGNKTLSERTAGKTNKQQRGEALALAGS